MLTPPKAIPNAICGIRIGVFQRKIKLANFEKLLTDSYFSLPKTVVQTLDITTIFPKKAFP